MIRTKFQTNLETQKIVIKVDKDSKDNNYIPKVAGSSVPLVRFHDETIEFNTIDSLDFSFGSQILPFVSISFNDVDEKFKYEYPIKVGSLFTLFLGLANDTLHKPIKGDFYLSNASSGSMSYNISGILHLPEMYELRNRTFIQRTSLEIFEEIAKECKLGFSTNIDSSNDKMDWIQFQNNLDFLTYLKDRAFVSNNTYIHVFIDQFWNLNVVDVKKAIDTKPFDTFKSEPITGKPLGENDTIIAGTNITQATETYKYFIYDEFRMFDDYSTIALTQPKKLRLVDFNVSSFVESELILQSPHKEHIQEESVFTSFSNDNVYDGYFGSKIRNSYNELLTKGQRFMVDVPYYVPGMYMFMSYNQEIYNPNIYTSGQNQNETSTLDDDSNAKPESSVKSKTVTLNQSLSGEVLVTGISISYSNSMAANTSLLQMSLSLFLKPVDANYTVSTTNYQKPVPIPMSDLPDLPDTAYNPNEPTNPSTNPNAGNGTYSIPRAVARLNNDALGYSVGECAKYVRRAIESGGLSTNGRPVSAKNYDSFLPRIGFSEVSTSQLSNPQTGDIAVIQSIPGHKHGHICMWNGSQWVSDFRQRTMLPGQAYRNNPPRVNLYRWID